MANLDISPEELAALHLENRCYGCGHLSVLHGIDVYDSEFCRVAECKCDHDKNEWEADGQEKDRLQGSGITLCYADGTKADLDVILAVMHALE